MKKQVNQYIIKVWGTCIIVAPFLFTLIMIKSIISVQRPFMEAILVIGITLVLGLIYFLPSLLITFVLVKSIVNAQMKMFSVKIIVMLLLFFLTGLQSLYLYKNNLSLIYKGTAVMVLSYLVLFSIVPWIYELTPTEPD